MQLIDYMKLKKITLKQAAAELGVSVVTVSRWRTGTRVPSANYMPLIFGWSEGRVTPNDFHRVI